MSETRDDLDGGGTALITGDGGDFVAEVKNYVTGDGKRIEHHVPVVGARPAESFEFYGHGEATIAPQPACPVGAKAGFRYPIEGATSLKEAVELMNDAANAYANEHVIPQMKAQLAQQAKAAGLGGPQIQIAQPGDLPPNGPGGRGGLPPTSRFEGL